MLLHKAIDILALFTQDEYGSAETLGRFLVSLKPKPQSKLWGFGSLLFNLLEGLALASILIELFKFELSLNLFLVFSGK
jgi:hypothetical protein